MIRRAIVKLSFVAS